LDGWTDRIAPDTWYPLEHWCLGSSLGSDGPRDRSNVPFRVRSGARRGGATRV